MDATARRTLRAVTRELRKLLEGVEYRQGETQGTFTPTAAAFHWTFRLLLLRSLQVRKLTSSTASFADIEEAMLLDSLVRACAPDADWFPEFLAMPLPTPPVQVLRRCVNLVWGLEPVRGQRLAKEEMLTPPAALSWAYQFWMAVDKKEVLERVRTRKSAKVEGEDVISATSLYSEPYMARFLLQNSLAALWRKLHPKLPLPIEWAYPVATNTVMVESPESVPWFCLLDPACGSGHLLLEAFEYLSAVPPSEIAFQNPRQVCDWIFLSNLHGIDVDERAVAVARAALAMRAAEKAPGFRGQSRNVVALARRLPARTDHVTAFLKQFPDIPILNQFAEHTPSRNVLKAIFRHLESAHELGSLLRTAELLQAKTPYHYPLWETVVIWFGASSEPSPFASAPYLSTAADAMQALTILRTAHDIVITNPPYLGPKYMGQTLRRHLAECYPDTREDLQTAFLQRCFELTREGGVTATVTVKSWLYQASFRKFRRDVLSQYTLGAFADLGSNAFHADQGLHHGVSVILTCFGKQPPAATHEVQGVRAVTGKGPEAKEQLVRAALADTTSTNRFTFPQASLLALADAPFCYWLPASLLAALVKGPTLAGRVKQGLATTDNNRFLRFAWEVPLHDEHQRWFPCAKGGTHCKWVGLNYVRVNWQCDGAAIKSAIVEKYPYLSGWQWVAKNADYYFKPGLTYSYMCYGTLSARLMQNALFEVASIGVFPEPEQLHLVLAVLNSRTASWILRALSQKHMFQAGITEKLPLPPLTAERRERVVELVKRCIEFKSRLICWDLCEMQPRPFFCEIPRPTVRGFLRELLEDYEWHASALHATEQELEPLVSWPLAEGDVHRLNEEMGPAKQPASPGEQELLADYLTFQVLEFFGLCWLEHRQHSPSLMASVQGRAVLPLVAGCGVPTVHELLRECLARDIRCGVEEAEREIAMILGMSLPEWLLTRFFRHQIRRWKRRPLLWQLQSRPARRGSPPAFACLVAYHRLDGGTLREIRENLVAPLGVSSLKEFIRALERVEKEGFSSPELWTRLREEPLDSWCSLDGKTAPPRDRDALLKQESRYLPDLNDGVRVNLAPLQREGLLAVNVLAARDVERAIADRAAWRADERRLCRDGKLPRPGWWTTV